MSKTSKQFSLDERVKIIEDKFEGGSVEDLSKKYNCSPYKIRKVLKEQDQTQEEWERSETKKGDKLEKEMQKFYHECRERHPEIQSIEATEMFYAEAVRLAEKIGIHNFDCEEWILKFEPQTENKAFIRKSRDVNSYREALKYLKEVESFFIYKCDMSMRESLQSTITMVSERLSKESTVQTNIKSFWTTSKRQ